MNFENNNVNYQTNDSSMCNEIHVTECFCKIGSVTYPVDRMNKYDANNNNVAYKEIVNFNRNFNGFPDSIKPYENHRTF